MAVSYTHLELTVKTKEQITLGTAGKLYLIIMTEPQSLPVEYRDAFTYKNHIKTSEDGTSWSEQGNATISLYGGGDILKELGQTFTYDGTTVTSKNDGKDNEMCIRDRYGGCSCRCHCSKTMNRNTM